MFVCSPGATIVDVEEHRAQFVADRRQTRGFVCSC